MQVGGHLPGRSAGDLALCHHLRQRHKTQLRIARGDKLVGLRNVFALHNARRQRGSHAEFVHHLRGGQAVGREFGVGDGQMLEVTGLEHGALCVDIAGLRAPQHQRTDGIGETGVGHSLAFALEFGRGGVIRSQQDLERGAIGDLRIELARGAKRQLGLVARVGLESCGNFLHGRREVGGHCHRHLVGMGRRHSGKAQPDDGEGAGQEVWAIQHDSMALMRYSLME